VLRLVPCPPISTLPAGITHRVGCFGCTPTAACMLCRARHLYLCRRWSEASPHHDPGALGPGGLDLCAVMFCSMFARMPPVRPGSIRYPQHAAEFRRADRNGSSRHVSASSDTRSEGKKNECRSGLLICGFGVRVPGGAPVLTWDYTHSGPLVKAVFPPVVCLLVGKGIAMSTADRGGERSNCHQCVPVATNRRQWIVTPACRQLLGPRSAWPTTPRA